MNAVNIVSTNFKLDIVNACSAASGMSEKENYEEALFYKDHIDDEMEDLKVYKIGSIILVDSGAAFT